VAAGISTLTGVDPDRAVDAVRDFASDEQQRRVAATRCPYGDGHTSERVAEILSDSATKSLLRLEEPDFVGRPIDVLPSGQLLVG
jgi:UDP-N-acetylglucosamine 2-epimerase